LWFNLVLNCGDEKGDEKNNRPYEEGYVQPFFGGALGSIFYPMLSGWDHSPEHEAQNYRNRNLIPEIVAHTGPFGS
jgi:hypothetical protein